jgi:hypothetical protein
MLLFVAGVVCIPAAGSGSPLVPQEAATILVEPQQPNAAAAREPTTILVIRSCNLWAVGKGGENFSLRKSSPGERLPLLAEDESSFRLMTFDGGTVYLNRACGRKME